jgi:hypothetical protein
MRPVRSAARAGMSHVRHASSRPRLPKGSAASNGEIEMRLLRSLTPTAFAVGLVGPIVLFGSSLPTRAQSSFDGSWSVLIITETGECDRAYRYGIRIEHGQIIYSGEAGVTFSGRIESNGQVTATVRRGEQSAAGSGRLSGSSGAGTWKGQSNTGACGGRWEAERR